MTSESSFEPSSASVDEPDEVTNHRFIGSEMRYRVKWSGRPQCESTWENAAALAGFNKTHLIFEYMDSKIVGVPDIESLSAATVEIISGFKKNGVVYYKIKYESGLTIDVESRVLLEQQGGILIDYLEHVVERKLT